MHIAENGMRLFATKSYNAEKLCFFGQKRIFQSKRSDVTASDADWLKHDGALYFQPNYITSL